MNNDSDDNSGDNRDIDSSGNGRRDESKRRGKSVRREDREEKRGKLVIGQRCWPSRRVGDVYCTLLRRLNYVVSRAYLDPGVAITLLKGWQFGMALTGRPEGGPRVASGSRNLRQWRLCEVLKRSRLAAYC